MLSCVPPTQDDCVDLLKGRTPLSAAPALLKAPACPLEYVDFEALEWEDVAAPVSGAEAGAAESELEPEVRRALVDRIGDIAKHIAAALVTQLASWITLLVKLDLGTGTCAERDRLLKEIVSLKNEMQVSGAKFLESTHLRQREELFPPLP